MINDIKVDHTKPVWAEVWGKGTNDSNRYTRIYLFSFTGRHYCVHNGDENAFVKGGNYRMTYWEHIELPKAKKTIQLDARTCPRRPAVTHPQWAEGSEVYPNICEEGLEFGNGPYLTWSTLKDEGYLINGLPASREVAL